MFIDFLKQEVDDLLDGPQLGLSKRVEKVASIRFAVTSAFRAVADWAAACQSYPFCNIILEHP